MEYLSEKCLNLTGYSNQEIIDNEPCSFSQLIHPDDLQQVLLSIQEAILNNDPFLSNTELSPVMEL
jgi:hypothetical protein